MPKIIPQEIKNKVIAEWLSGIPRDTIASINGIATGTVTEIIQQTKRNSIPDIDLLRAIAFEIRKKNLNVNDFATSIRLKGELDLAELTENEVESLLTHANIYCFKKGIGVKDFVYKIGELSAFAANNNISIYDIPTYIAEKEDYLQRLDNEISLKKQQLKQSSQRYIKDRQNFQWNNPRQPMSNYERIFQAKLCDKDLEIISLKYQIAVLKGEVSINVTSQD